MSGLAQRSVEQYHHNNRGSAPAIPRRATAGTAPCLPNTLAPARWEGAPAARLAAGHQLEHDQQRSPAGGASWTARTDLDSPTATEEPSPRITPTTEASCSRSPIDSAATTDYPPRAYLRAPYPSGVRT